MDVDVRKHKQLAVTDVSQGWIWRKERTVCFSVEHTRRRMNGSHMQFLDADRITHVEENPSDVHAKHVAADIS